MSINSSLPISTGNCSICNESADILDLVPTDCGHLFHEACIGKWVNTKPVCPLDHRKVEHIGDKNISQCLKSTCQVCQEDAVTSELTPITCSHLFHEACIGQWAANNPTCPICRDDIDLTDEKRTLLEATRTREDNEQHILEQLIETAGSNDVSHLSELLQRPDMRQEWIEEAYVEASAEGCMNVIKVLQREQNLSIPALGRGLVMSATNGLLNTVQTQLQISPGRFSIDDRSLAFSNAAANNRTEVMKLLLANNAPILPAARGKAAESLLTFFDSNLRDSAQKIFETLQWVVPIGTEIPSKSRGILIEKLSKCYYSEGLSWSSEINKVSSNWPLDAVKYLMPAGTEIPLLNLREATINSMEQTNLRLARFLAPEIPVSPMLIAVRIGRADAIRILMSKPEEVSTDARGECVAFVNEKAGRLGNRLIKLLLPKGTVIPTERRDQAASYAIKQGNIELLDFLLPADTELSPNTKMRLSNVKIQYPSEKISEWFCSRGLIDDEYDKNNSSFAFQEIQPSSSSRSFEILDPQQEENSSRSLVNRINSVAQNIFGNPFGNLL